MKIIIHGVITVWWKLVDKYGRTICRSDHYQRKSSCIKAAKRFASMLLNVPPIFYEGEKIG